MPGGQILINGDWRAPASGAALPVFNPSDGAEFAKIARGSAEDIDGAVTAARAALEGGAWSKVTAVERGRLLSKMAQKVADHAEELAVLEAKDTGKPISQARADANALARYFEFYGGAADKIHGETIPYLNGYTVFTLREPHGVCGQIIPWNYPMQIFGRTACGALTMGNAVVMKPAEEACLSVLRVAELMLEVGFPPGAINIVPGLGAEAGAALADHPGIDHLSFTGSRQVGALVQAASAKYNRPCTMELGGKSPQVVFADADMDAALPFITRAIIQNAGQTCSAGSRLLVEDKVYDTFVGRVAEKFKALRAGPWDRDLDVGPLISKKQKERVDGFVEKATAAGVKLLAAGETAANAPAGGYYVAPQVYGDVPVDHLLAQEEVFGPVLAAIRFRDEADAIRIANATPYGLVAGVWTRDGGKQMRLAKAIKAGQVFINNYGAGGGIELPFGGVKGSGFGREKGFTALHDFSTLKTVAIQHG
ncbi:aldehyde dehydrogenase family protein [Reyranella sp. CPCC 100927]|uniref:aldehyde dehydrogenase family protein n=1 Tax=Reyranella sp. CPCC 100927 TaxID=2599616 RepID=UPI0011B6403D|nr:aldehyde dehydrogenase family protein [Reyranella sp. CPCC 100927]TWT14955.1 aldehyde dehydrogenase family protein [Reyranella sp. CPCC 100927]